jgi:hypothetical protein
MRAAPIALVLPLAAAVVACSDAGSPTSLNSPASLDAPRLATYSAAPCDTLPYTRKVSVTTATELKSAISNAQPGDVIRLADGTYTGTFNATRPGTATKPITVCGSKSAVLTSGSRSSASGFRISTSYWVASGFHVKNSSVGVLIVGSGSSTGGANHNIIDNLLIDSLGTSGINVRVYSKYNIIRNTTIRNTGKVTAEYGEGVYLGSANGAWASRTGGQPDRSDSNQVVNNVIGPNVTSEHVDVKEGTTGGIISGNTFYGSGMTYSDAWINVKGNRYTVSGNKGTKANKDGFQVHIAVSGWGQYNTFRSNTADVQGGEHGFHIYSGAPGNIVGCDNVTTNATSGASNVSCK